MKPLTIAVSQGNSEIVKFILDNGAFPNWYRAHKVYALHDACVNGFISIVNLLLDRGAKANNICEKGRTALHYAVSGNHLEVVKCLCQRNVTRSIKDNQQMTSLQLAEYLGGREEIVNYLKSYNQEQ